MTLMVTSLKGLSFESVGVLAILSTISFPEVTSPKMV